MTRVAGRPERVAVIGVGIVGACVGWNLVQRGVQVVFVDAGHPGAGVTNWSFSWVNASSKTEHRSYFELNAAGLVAYRELAAEIGPQPWWHPHGHLRWADDGAGEAQLLRTAALLATRAYRVEVLTGAEVRRRLEPGLRVPGERPVIFCPDEAWVHGRHLVRELVRRSVELGAERRFGIRCTGIRTAADGSIKTVSLSDGTSLDVTAVVNSAGPQAPRVADLVGRRLPLRREPGAVARIDCSQAPVRRAMHAPHVEIRPDGQESVLLHSRDVDALIDSVADPAELGRRLHQLAEHVVPELGGARIAQTRVAERPIPSDGFPSVGAVPSVPGYFEAVSHSGVTLAPIIGRLLASEIVSGRVDEILADFRPERFP